MPDTTDPGQPPSVPPESVPPRRAFLRGALGAGAVGAVGGAAAGYAYGATRPAPASQQALERAQAGVLPPVPFHGRYQAGILPPSQRQTAVISFNATADGRADYSPHHNPFEYYKSTANPKHLPPSSEASIGHTDQANHQYDLSDFYTTLKDGNMPAVSFLKAAEYQDAHPGYSDPLDEQTFLVNTINQIEKSKFWKNTAIVIAYDDSDGWYDHQKPVIVNGSNTSLDAAICSSSPVRLAGIPVRCGYSQRLPMLVISPWSRTNYVSHQLTNTASIIKFAENNWLGGKRIGGGSFDASSNSLSGMLQFFAPHVDPVILNPTTGAVARN